MDLSFDWKSIVVHLAVYLTVLVLMKFLYVDPVLRLLKKRDSLTEGRLSSSADKQAKILEFKQQYEKSVSSLKTELEARRLSELRTLQHEMDELTKRTQKEMNAKIQTNHQQLESNLADLRKQLNIMGDKLGIEMAEAVTSGRVVRT